MLFAIHQHSIEVRKWNDKSAALNFVQGCDGGSVILGENAYQEDQFYTVVVQYDYAAHVKSYSSAVRSWGVVIISESHGLQPQLVLLDNGILVIGWNHEICGLNVESRSIVFQYSFDTLFHAFLYLPGDRTLIVRNEIGVLVFDENGSKLWALEKDVVTDCLIDNSTIELQFMDSDPVTLELATGRPIEGISGSVLI